MLQSNRARSLAVNLHSELGGDKEKYLALGKRDGPKKKKNHLCYSDNIFNRIIPKVSQLGVKPGAGGSF